MMQSFSMIYTLSFPYLGRMTSQLLSLVSDSWCRHS